MLKRGFNHALLTINLIHLEELEQFLEETETLWSKRLNKFEVKGEGIQDEVERQEFFEHYYDKWVVYRDTFPRITKYNILVSAYSFLEKNIREYYEKAKEIYSIEDEVINDVCFDHINWFRKNFGKNIFTKADFNYFMNINQLRNRISHSDGSIDRDKHIGIMNIIKETSLIFLNKLDEVEFDKQYIKNSLSVISRMIENVHYCVYPRE